MCISIGGIFSHLDIYIISYILRALPYSKCIEYEVFSVLSHLN